MVATLRVPSWAAGAAVVDRDGHRKAGPGSFSMRRRFSVGEEIHLDLPVAPRWTAADPRIDAVRGCVAVERGPLVLCVESTDIPGGPHVDHVRVDPDRPLRDDGAVTASGVLVEHTDAAWPYGQAGQRDRAGAPVRIPLVPYHSWAARGPSTMRVWLPTV
ncbi:beta-L-arabinofuranosidase domain-containing protein [Pseudonocardia sp. MH-G8]|uniref:beta-L-arabinofuranosidase domain-containing protein n=1 Tax=Pseudonocardia sp. MH-G8 TaxID=1854588 RepID=UPI001E60C1FE|nr:beta-L-arabinofuranosidase domain-containing protein [Pseudonocardia sp. MH-G8]